MTKKDYILFADMFGKKLVTLKQTGWSADAHSLLLAVLEDTMHVFKEDNERFQADRFIEYINKNYDVNLLTGSL